MEKVNDVISSCATVMDKDINEANEAGKKSLQFYVNACCVSLSCYSL